MFTDVVFLKCRPYISTTGGRIVPWITALTLSMKKLLGPRIVALTPLMKKIPWLQIWLTLVHNP